MICGWQAGGDGVRERWCDGAMMVLVSDATCGVMVLEVSGL